MNSTVVNALVKRRAELAGVMEKTHESLRKMVLDVESLDATIVQFDSDFQGRRGADIRPDWDWDTQPKAHHALSALARCTPL
jgi:hypothetical protein